MFNTSVKSIKKRKIRAKFKEEILDISETKTEMVIDNRINNSSDTCRVCLREGSISIYSENPAQDLAEALSSIGNISIEFHDDFPKALCYDCHNLLQGAITLRKTAQDSDNILRNKLSQDMCIVNIDENYLGTESVSFQQDNVNNDGYSDAESNNSDLEEEQRKHHCVLCNITFPNKKTLLLHRRTKDHLNARYKCPICGKGYGIRTYKDHIGRHNESNKKQCDICGKLVPGNHLKRHRIIHFDEFPYKCQHCPYKGRNKDALKGHMKSHSGVKPFQCPICSVRCAKKFNLQQHMLTHKDGFDYQCGTCHKGYHTKKELEQHVKVGHAGVKDHICNMCGKAFGYRKQMMQHQRNVHKRSKLPSGRTPLYLTLESDNKPHTAANSM